MAPEEIHDERPADQEAPIPMPKPTAWPMVVAVGVALLAVGIATTWFVSAAGLVILLIAMGGWIAELAPGCGEIAMPLVPPEQRAQATVASSRRIAEPRPGSPRHRSPYPEHVYPYSAGAVGGLLGGAVMAAVALTYGLISGRGIWYPINMLSAIILTNYNELNVALLEQFDLTALLVAIVLHVTASVMVGLCFGILLPTLPASPIFWGGVAAPLLWTGAVYSFMGIINPVMNRHVDWPWFVLSQFAYGLTVGIYVTRTNRVAAKRVQDLPPEDQE